MNWWQTANQFVPDNEFYEDGVFSVGGVSYDTGLGQSPSGNGWDPWWTDLSGYAGDGEQGYDDYSNYSAAPSDFTDWLWVGGGVALLYFLIRR